MIIREIHCEKNPFEVFMSLNKEIREEAALLDSSKDIISEKLKKNDQAGGEQ